MNREERRVADLQMMQDPTEWPVWPYLPVKRSFNDYPQKNTGILCERGITKPIKVEPIVYLRNMYAPIAPGTTMNDLEKIEYESFEALVDDGWTVD